MLSNFESSVDGLELLANTAANLERLRSERDSLIARLHYEGVSFPRLAAAAGISVGQAHRLSRSAKRPAITLGYEGRSLDEFLGVLATGDVSIVVDVRLTPLSRKPGFSKRRLAEALSERGVTYRHLPSLGNPRENRDGYRMRAPDAISRFESILDSQAAGDLRKLGETAANERVALLCFERDHRQCHRSAIARRLQALDPAIAISNL